MLFQQNNACPHTAAAMQRAVCGVQQLPWPARNTELSPIDHVWDMMKGERSLSPEPISTIAELRQQMQDAWDNIRSRTDKTYIFLRIQDDPYFFFPKFM